MFSGPPPPCGTILYLRIYCIVGGSGAGCRRHVREKTKFMSISIDFYEVVVNLYSHSLARRSQEVIYSRLVFLNSWSSSRFVFHAQNFVEKLHWNSRIVTPAKAPSIEVLGVRAFHTPAFCPHHMVQGKQSRQRELEIGALETGVA
ncbi:hypothetical protein BDN72DRAFT_846802 [Pluteus cervinus]|uniref:Uncharacterized protein n=1 Tax=Pluteus cervinus TaxID=181527 RepID=A0ACD3AEY9_9AGAR|nr:hypothetical protein BDN72DRAFT_846802 [Pluteus cervinus]